MESSKIEKKNFLKIGIDKLVKRWQKVVKRGGEYFIVSSLLKMTLFSIVNVLESSQSEYGKGRQARKKSEKYAKALTEIVKEDNNNTIESC